MRASRAAFQNALSSKLEPFQEAILSKRLQTIFGAGGNKTAARRKEGGDGRTVELDEEHRDFRRDLYQKILHRWYTPLFNVKQSHCVSNANIRSVHHGRNDGIGKPWQRTPRRNPAKDPLNLDR